MIPSRIRRLRVSIAAGLAAAVLVGGSLAGCSTIGGVGEGGALLTGRSRLPPLSRLPAARPITVQMLPFTGLPVTIADEIYKSFREKAAEEGIELVHRLEDPATFRVQGHFVALGQDTSATIIYTYDIFDVSGARVHHIVGQEISKQASGDAWAGANGDLERRLASRAVWELKVWLKRAEP